MNVIKKHSQTLSKRHPALNKLITVIGDLEFDIPLWHRIEDAVLYAVIGQMLSSAASDSIITRLQKRFSTSKKIILWATRTSGRSGPLCGVSQRKRKALGAWLEFSERNKGAWKKWRVVPVEQYREEITRIWGFGDWAADMIAIFYLARMDIWPASDAGIKRSVAAVFGSRGNGNITNYVEGCETTAALYFWEVLNRNLLNEFRENGQFNA
jgi:3-methyladenine DNA glycosylase/8-oxoguanine DNA glycosylase